jgi:nucleotidyltransferase substrate binding protein (TIGR01987 family)
MKDDKLKESIALLEHALEFEAKARKDRFYFSGIAKCFENCLEYAWKHFRKKASDEGLEVYSPKDAIKQAGRLGIIHSVEDWLDYLNTRNLAVHDYLGVEDEDYLRTIKKFLADAKRLSLK